MEVTGTDGAVSAHEIGGRAAVGEYSPRTIGLSLAGESCCSLDCSIISFRLRRRIIAVTGGDASGAGRCGPSRTSGPAVSRLCSVP